VIKRKLEEAGFRCTGTVGLVGSYRKEGSALFGKYARVLVFLALPIRMLYARAELR
jgi:hypothetical protein